MKTSRDCLVRPHVIVCLGATAAQSMLGSTFRVTAHRGERIGLPPDLGVDIEPEPVLMATVHPSSLLRDRSERRRENYESFVEDLRKAHGTLGVMFRENQPG